MAVPPVGRLQVAATAIGTRLHLGPDRLRAIRRDRRRHPASRFDPIRGWRAVVRFISDPTRPLAQQRTSAALHIDGAMPRDNFEGVSLTSAPQGAPSGATRLYLISDDQAIGANQRTLLLAFDWVAPPAPPPMPAPVKKRPVRRR